MAAILNFPIFFQNAKHKYACISKTVLDRAILTKFDPQGNSGEQMVQFSKMFCPAKNGGYFQFSNFSQKSQNTKMLVSRKSCDCGKIFNPQGICEDYTFSIFNKYISLTKNGGRFAFSNLFLPNFPPKIYPSQIWGSLSIFKFVTKSAKHQIASVSLTVQDRAISSKFLKHCIQDNYPAQEPLFLYSGFVEL